MFCPKCKSESIKVVDTMPGANNDIYRRRRCLNCGESFRSIEKIDDGTKAFQYGYSEAHARKTRRR